MAAQRGGRARRRIRDRFRALFRNDDVPTYRVARKVLEGRYAWLEEGIIGTGGPGGP